MLLRWLVFLADVTLFDCGIDVTIDVDPVHGVFRSESSLLYAEMTVVQPVQYERLHALRDDNSCSLK